MSNLLIFIGRLAGMLGVALGAASVGARILGVFFVGILQVGRYFKPALPRWCSGHLPTRPQSPNNVGDRCSAEAAYTTLLTYQRQFERAI